MRIAVMQPYFFPYPGYYELIQSVDLFVYFTDVQYVRRSWINRNRIRSTSGWQYITVPVVKHKQTARIDEIEISGPWVDKHLSAFQHHYRSIDPELLQFYKSLSSWKKLAPMLKFTVEWLCEYLGVSLAVADSSEFPSQLRGEERILDLCKKFGASTYVNLPGGIALYHKEKFDSEGIDLEFTPMTMLGELSILDNCFDESHFRIETRPQQTSGATV